MTELEGHVKVLIKRVNLGNEMQKSWKRHTGSNPVTLAINSYIQKEEYKQSNKEILNQKKWKRFLKMKYKI